MKARVLGILTVFVGLFAWSVPTRSAEPHWPNALVIGTASPGGTYYDYGEGLARVLSRDLGIIAAGRVLGLPGRREIAAHAERWRPWRSYATQVLWGLLDHPINRLPTSAPPPPSRPARPGGTRS